MAFKAHFLNVGCADCTIFEIGNYIVVIDCGYRKTGNGVSKPTDIYDYLKNVIGTTQINLLIVSHPHHDHYIAMEDMLGKITVGKFWGSPYKRRHDDPSLSLEDWNTYNRLKAQFVPDPNKRFACIEGANASFSDCEFRVLGPKKIINDNPSRDCHDGCLVISVSSPANKFIICGDASDSELDQVRESWKLTNCTILRASHHGSENGANVEFIKAVTPEVTIISTKSGFFENLPSNIAIQRYQNYSKHVYRTDLKGTITAILKI
jgi:competence protein ComEC